MRFVRSKLENNRIRIPIGIRAFNPDPQAPPDLTYHAFTALVDTGATRTAVSQNVINRAGMLSQGKIPVGNVRRTEQHRTYLFYVSIWPVPDGLEPPAPYGIGDEIMGIDGGDSRFFDVLLGMDIISRGSLKIEFDGSFELAFR